MATVKARTLGVVAALVTLPTAAALIPGRLDAVTRSTRSTKSTRSWTQQPARQSAGTAAAARLFGVKVLVAADAPSADRDPARRRRRRLGASCTNPGPGTNAYNLRGSRVNGP